MNFCELKIEARGWSDDHILSIFNAVTNAHTVYT